MSTRIAGPIARLGAFALLLGLAQCGDIDFGDNPRREFPKETGPLTLPPRSLLTAPAP